MTRRVLLGDGQSLREALREMGQDAAASPWSLGTLTGVVREPSLQSVTPSGAPAGVRTLSGAYLAQVAVLREGDELTLSAWLSQDSPAGLSALCGTLQDARCDWVHGVLFEPEAAHIDIPSPARSTPAANPAAPLVPVPAPAAVATAPAGFTAGAPAPSAPAAVVPQAPGSSPGLPVKPPRREVDLSEGPALESGDLVDHFAFGRCEVLKSDGDRLHIRLPKDGRAKELALEMLRVTPQPAVDGKRLFRLDRRS